MPGSHEVRDTERSSKVDGFFFRELCPRDGSFNTASWGRDALPWQKAIQMFYQLFTSGFLPALSGTAASAVLLRTGRAVYSREEWGHLPLADPASALASPSLGAQ